MRLAATGGLHVVERVKRGIYSLSRLARWVHEGDVVVAGKGWQAPGEVKMDMDVAEVEEKPVAAPDALNWWQAARIEEPASDLGLGEDFAGLRVDVVFGPSGEGEGDGGREEPSFMDVLEHRSQSLAPVSKSGNVEGGDSSGLLDPQGIGGDGEVMAVDGVEADAKQSPDELLAGMREQYLQALYISKVSSARWWSYGVFAYGYSRPLWPILPKVH